MRNAAVDADRRAGANEIVESREIPRALNAKLFTVISSDGLVTGSPISGRSYKLAQLPSKNFFSSDYFFVQTG